jgi:hypothetical protein
MRVARSPVVRVHPDGTSSRRASEIVAQLRRDRANWGRHDEGERPEGMFDNELLELAVALRWEYA